jgi:RNA polymerase sporulation-specific sigma factor
MTPLTPEQSQMVEDNIGLAYSTAWKLLPQFPLEFDEILSLCFLGLCKAVKKFNPDKGFKFSTFAAKIMYYEVLTFVSPQTPKIKSLYLEEVFSSETNFNWEDLLGTYEVEDEIVCKVATEQIIAKLDSIEINEKYREIMRIHSQEPELSQEEIGQRVGCSPKVVWWAFKKSREKLKPIYTG